MSINYKWEKIHSHSFMTLHTLSDMPANNRLISPHVDWQQPHMDTNFGSININVMCRELSKKVFYSRDPYVPLKNYTKYHDIKKF